MASCTCYSCPFRLLTYWIFYLVLKVWLRVFWSFCKDMYIPWQYFKWIFPQLLLYLLSLVFFFSNPWEELSRCIFVSSDIPLLSHLPPERPIINSLPSQHYLSDTLAILEWLTSSPLTCLPLPSSPSSIIPTPSPSHITYPLPSQPNLSDTSLFSKPCKIDFISSDIFSGNSTSWEKKKF